MEIVEVAGLKEKGRFLGNMILIRKGLSPEERRMAIRHEANHARFYTTNMLGKVLNRVLNERLTYIVYGFWVLATWLLNAIPFVAACFPLYVQAVHEISTCVKYGGRLSFTYSCVLILVLVVMFLLRIVIPI